MAISLSYQCVSTYRGVVFSVEHPGLKKKAAIADIGGGVLVGLLGFFLILRGSGSPPLLIVGCLLSFGGGINIAGGGTVLALWSVYESASEEVEKRVHRIYTRVMRDESLI